jgi:small ligand-binding sensory domain FIST
VVRAGAGAGTGPDALAAADAALRTVDEALGGREADLAVLTVGSGYRDAVPALAAHVRARLRPRHLLGATAAGVIAGPSELESAPVLSVWAASLPGAVLAPLRYGPPDEGAEWLVPPADARALLVLAEPFSFPTEAFLRWLAQARPGLPVSGGLASAGAHRGHNRLVLDDDVASDGAVAVALGGRLVVRTLVSQGCRPVGDSFVVTRAAGNVVAELAGAPALQRLEETFAAASPRDRSLLRHGLHIGVVIDEYRSEFRAGDFLVRAVLGADPESGGLAVGDAFEVGRTVRFHVRDAHSADEDLRAMLRDLDDDVDAGLLFTCNGRGARLFGTSDHDAELISEALGGSALGGMFCAGEIGPVGARSHLHGFTASLLAVGSDPGAPTGSADPDVTGR